MIEQKIFLPLNFDPIIQTYQIRNYELGILQDCYPWIYNKHINVCYNYKNENLLFDHIMNEERWFRREGVMKVQKLRFHKTIFDCNYIDILQKTKEMLLDKWYVMGYFDEYYIPSKSKYLKTHYRHSSFIYGFDDTNKEFYAIAYTSNRKYEPFTIPYDVFEKSINVNFDRSNEAYVKKGIERIEFDFVKVNENYNFNLNLHEIYTKMYDYMHSIDSMNIDKSEYVYGVECERKFVEYIKNSSKKLDERYSRYFIDFKNLMLMRIEYLEDNGYIKKCYAEDYRLISQKQQTIHSLFIKFNITQDNEIIKRIVSIEENIIDCETTMIRGILGDLHQYLTNLKKKEYR